MGAMLSVFQGNTFFFEWEVALQQWLQSVFGTGFGAKIAGGERLYLAGSVREYQGHQHGFG